MSKYVLFIFKEPSDEFTMPKEVSVLEKIATGVSRGASCGPINLCFFPSNHSKAEISTLLKEVKLNFILTEEKDSMSSLPSYITKMFDKNFLSEHDEGDGIRKFGNLDHPENIKKSKPEKISLEDQLKEAVKTEDYPMAAILRDKIANKKLPPPVKNPKDPAAILKELFKD